MVQRSQGAIARREVLQPGIRGGRWYRTRTGRIRYGIPPSPDSQLHLPLGPPSRHVWENIGISVWMPNNPVYDTEEELIRAIAQLAFETQERLVVGYKTPYTWVAELFGYGTQAECAAQPAVMAAHASMLQAREMIIVHNHPSGNPRPSDKDRALLRAVGDIATAAFGIARVSGKLIVKRPASETVTSVTFDHRGVQSTAEVTPGREFRPIAIEARLPELLDTDAWQSMPQGGAVVVPLLPSETLPDAGVRVVGYERMGAFRLDALGESPAAECLEKLGEAIGAAGAIGLLVVARMDDPERLRKLTDNVTIIARAAHAVHRAAINVHIYGVSKDGEPEPVQGDLKVVGGHVAQVTTSAFDSPSLLSPRVAVPVRLLDAGRPSARASKYVAAGSPVPHWARAVIWYCDEAGIAKNFSVADVGVSHLSVLAHNILVGALKTQCQRVEVHFVGSAGQQIARAFRRRLREGRAGEAFANIAGIARVDAMGVSLADSTDGTTEVAQTGPVIRAVPLFEGAARAPAYDAVTNSHDVVSLLQRHPTRNRAPAYVIAMNWLNKVQWIEPIRNPAELLPEIRAALAGGHRVLAWSNDNSREWNKEFWRLVMDARRLGMLMERIIVDGTANGVHRALHEAA